MDDKHLVKKARSRVLGFVVGLWLILFVPAWDPGFWQAWIYWAIFTASVICITGYFLKVDPRLIERRLSAGPAAEHEKSQKIIQSFTSIAMIFLFVVPGLEHRFSESGVPLYGIFAGDFLILVGFYLVFLTFRENRFASAIIGIEKEQVVISTGPYALIRHPMYAGTSLLLIATPFALGSLWAIVPAMLTIAGIIWRLFEEEKFLDGNLPGYREYCTHVRFRLVPFVW